jgi:hypothetical protein
MGSPCPNSVKGLKRVRNAAPGAGESKDSGCCAVVGSQFGLNRPHVTVSGARAPSMPNPIPCPLCVPRVQVALYEHSGTAALLIPLLATEGGFS